METNVSEEEKRTQFLADEQAQWLTISESAFVLRTSKNKILAMLKAKTLRHRRDGKFIRIHVDDLRPSDQRHEPGSPC